jgi:hypothetical protein
MPTKVFSYGCAQPPAATQELLGVQYHLAHRYQNELVALENEYRRNLESLRLSHAPDYAAAVADHDVADRVVLAAVTACQSAKTRTGEATAPPAERQAVVAARAVELATRQRVNVARRVVHADPAWRTARDAERDAHSVRRKAAYAASALFWGTKNAVAEAVEAAAAASPFGPLRFRRWTRNGRLYCQVMGGIPTAAAFACADTRIQLERVPGSRKRAVARVRIGSDGRAPIWAELTAIIHRPLPPNGVVKGVSIVRKQGRFQFVGGRPVPRDEWAIHVVVTIPEEPLVAREGVVAVDVGWRRMADGSLRTGVCVDDTGHVTPLTLPADLCALWPAAEAAKSERDLLFNAMRDRCADWLDANDASDELREAAVTIRQWRGLSRLHGLIARFQEIREGSAIAAELRDWQYQDSLLEMRERCDIRKALATRLDVYRKFAAGLGARYGTIVVEKLNVAEMRRNALPEDDPDEVPKRWRNAASIGLLLTCIKQQGRAGVVAAPAAGTTSTCHACGSTQVWDRRKLNHTCDRCGATWDQDENAARNLLSRYASERGGDDETPGPDRGSQPSGVEKKPRIRMTRKGGRSKTGAETVARQGDSV